MRKLIAFAVIIACLSIAYYFAIFLPNTYHKNVKPSERVIKTDNASKEDLEMQEKCAKAAKAFFDLHIPVVPGMFADYECHYNKRENKYFILTKTTICAQSDSETTTEAENLFDVLANKKYGTFIHKTYYDGKPESFDWDFLDKRGHFEAEWNEAIKPYMEN